MSQLLSKVNRHILQFLHCSVCLPCRWTTHSSRRRHRTTARSAKRCDILSHSHNHKILFKRLNFSKILTKC